MAVNELLPGEIPEFRLVDKLAVAGRLYQPWQEAVEREVVAPLCNVAALSQSAITQAFAFPAGKQLELLRESDGRIVAILERYVQLVKGRLKRRKISLLK